MNRRIFLAAAAGAIIAPKLPGIALPCPARALPLTSLEIAQQAATSLQVTALDLAMPPIAIDTSVTLTRDMAAWDLNCYQEDPGPPRFPALRFKVTHYA